MESMYGPEYRFALTWEEVENALAEGAIVRDRDGDQVIKVNPDTQIYTYVEGNGDTSTHRAGGVFEGRFRIKDAGPTLAEMREAIASLRSGKVEWGVRDGDNIQDGFIDRTEVEDWIKRNRGTAPHLHLEVVSRVVSPWEKA